MRRQIELKFNIGYESYHEEFEDAVIQVASSLCGGCHVQDGVGYWASDGADHKQVFEGDVQSEHSFCISVSCELDKVYKVYQVMKNAISYNAALHKVNTDWVHVQESYFNGRHFSVEQHLIDSRWPIPLPTNQNGSCTLVRDLDFVVIGTE